MNTTLEALASYINLPIIVDLCIAHIFTSPRDYGTIYLIVVRSLNVSLNVSKTMLKKLSVIESFVHSLDVYIANFPLIYFILVIYFTS